MLEDLIARLEAATGLDRDLDRMISHHVVYAPQPERHLELSLRDKWDVPKYTASLDAAATLVPDGYWWTCGHCKREEHASCGPDDGSDERDEEGVREGFGATPAIALCISALKARSAPHA